MNTINSKDVVLGFSIASENLNINRDWLNQLNVFPVADKDTGTNMSISLKAVASSITSSGCPKDVFGQSVEILLQHAYGNSGTILTLFFQGVFLALPNNETLTPKDLAKGFSKGYEMAYEYTNNPMPGTILSVAKKIADISDFYYLEHCNLEDENPWTTFCREAFSVLPLTAAQNPVLSRYNMVDAGALGFCIILDSFRIGFSINRNSGKVPDSLTSNLPKYQTLENLQPVINIESPSPQSTSAYRYCTEVVIKLEAGNDLKEGSLNQQLEPLGDCLIIVTTNSHAKVHIHTNEPERAISTVAAYGEVISSKIDDMLE